MHATARRQLWGSTTLAHALRVRMGWSSGRVLSPQSFSGPCSTAQHGAGPGQRGQQHSIVLKRISACRANGRWARFSVGTRGHCHCHCHYQQHIRTYASSLSLSYPLLPFATTSTSSHPSLAHIQHLAQLHLYAPSARCGCISTDSTLTLWPRPIHFPTPVGSTKRVPEKQRRRCCLLSQLPRPPIEILATRNSTDFWPWPTSDSERYLASTSRTRRLSRVSRAAARTCQRRRLQDGLNPDRPEPASNTALDVLGGRHDTSAHAIPSLSHFWVSTSLRRDSGVIRRMSSPHATHWT